MLTMLVRLRTGMICGIFTPCETNTLGGSGVTGTSSATFTFASLASFARSARLAFSSGLI